ncbi:MAG: DUF393 domain-containing protein [Candidatus Hydrogenedentes bacterium]|nr:DUF393 domain-containing protein [Candidatus Hydrogenedentota bacterium]
MTVGQVALIYDAGCPLCTKAADWVRRSVPPRVVELVPCQDTERARRFPGISEAQCLEAMQLVLEDGRVLAGEEALPHLLRMMPRWRWVAAAFRIPGVAYFSPSVYRWIAKHRYMLSIIVARKQRTAGTGTKPEQHGH